MYAGANAGTNVNASLGAAPTGLEIFFDHHHNLKETEAGGNSFPPQPSFPGTGGPGSMMMGGGASDSNSLGLGFGLGFGRSPSEAPRLNMAFNNMNATFNGNVNANGNMNMDADNANRTPVTPRIIVEALDDVSQSQSHSHYNWDQFFNSGRPGF